MPPELAMQLPVAKELMEAMGYTVLEKAGYEADDILGTLARMCEEEDVEAYLLTGDRDALQLISDRVHVLLATNTETVDMNEEKRKIGEYTVLCSVNVGEKEVILASNEQSMSGDKFMCGFAERNDLFELCSECMVSDDYIEIVHLFGSRVANEAELFKEQVEKLDIPITLITQADCIPDHYSKDINGKIIAIDPKVLKPEFQRADRQLYYVTGGFGASANSRGSAVFCTNLHTGKSTRYERMDVMGDVKPERLPEWAKEKAQELSNKKRNKDKER